MSSVAVIPNFLAASMRMAFADITASGIFIYKLLVTVSTHRLAPDLGPLPYAVPGTSSIVNVTYGMVRLYYGSRCCASERLPRLALREKRGLFRLSECRRRGPADGSTPDKS